MVTLKIKDNSKQAKLLLEYMKGLSFVEILESNKKTNSKSSKLFNDIENSLKEVKLIQDGKLKPLTTNDFI